jgi:CheY-like chemotaxis protein
VEVEKIVPSGNERILFVDDEPPLADLGKQLLERLGYRVTICTSSVDALALFKCRPRDFDLVITDMTMPHMTGDILARKMMTIRPTLPVVICTGYSERITPELIDDLCIRGFVMKPLVRNELALAIRKALDE